MDHPLRAAPRSGLVLRPVGAICRGAGRGVPDRCGGHSVIPEGPVLDLALLRAVALYAPLAATVAAWCWRRPDRRTLAASGLAFVWNLPTLWVLHLLATNLGWWSYEAD